MEPLTVAEMLDAANNEIQGAKHEIAAGPITDRLIDALEFLHAALTHHLMGGNQHPRFKIGDRVTWQGQEGACFGTIKRQYKPENCDHYVLILDIGDDTEFPHGEQDVELDSPSMEPCPICDGTGRSVVSRDMAIDACDRTLEGQSIPCSNCGGIGGIEKCEPQCLEPVVCINCGEVISDPEQECKNFNGPMACKSRGVK